MALSFPLSPTTFSFCLSSDCYSSAIVSAQSILSNDGHSFPQNSQEIVRCNLLGKLTFVTISINATIPDSPGVTLKRSFSNMKERNLRSKTRRRKPLFLPSAYLNFWSQKRATSFGRHGMSMNASNGFNFRTTDHLSRLRNSTAAPSVTKVQETKTVLLCKCSTGIGELGSLVAVEWKPVLDQLLLVSSIALAYIAGIITPATPAAFLPSPSLSQGRRKVPGAVDTGLKNFHKTGDLQKETGGQISLQEEDLWSGAHSRLLTSIAAVDSLGSESLEHHSQLSLQAIARGPRLRLLLGALEHLHKEISNLQCDKDCFESDWTSTSVKVLSESVVPICQAWVLEEQLKKTKDQPSSTHGMLAAALGSFISTEHKSKLEAVKEYTYLHVNSAFGSQLEMFQGNKIMMSSLTVTGKAEFYADFLYFLCFGSVRLETCCSLQTLMNHRKVILEDVVIALADGAATLYLELISADKIFSENEWPNVMVPSISSTRMLERFRNEVALHGWIIENFQSVTAMFEDRFELWILKDSNYDMDRVQSTHFRRKWKNRLHKSRNTKQRPELILDHYRIPVRRVKELRALSGWRYYYSLYLEFSDVMGPLLKTIVTKLGEGISFLLVILIGRSLGLICSGIRQSIQWTSK